MATINHIAPELLRHFANGRLSMAGSDLVLRHLAVCEYCLELANAFWLAEPENRSAAFPAASGKRLERQVLQEIQRIKHEYHMGKRL